MRCLKDIAPKGEIGNIAIVDLNQYDNVIARAVFNLDYLDQCIKEMKRFAKENGGDLRKDVEVQFFTTDYAEHNGIKMPAISFRLRLVKGDTINDPDKGKIYPEPGYLAVGPFITWEVK